MGMPPKITPTLWDAVRPGKNMWRRRARVRPHQGLPVPHDSDENGIHYNIYEKGKRSALKSLFTIIYLRGLIYLLSEMIYLVAIK